MFIGPCIIAIAVLQPAKRTPPNTNRNKSSNTQRTENKTTNVVIHQHSRKLLKMDILMSETCWAHNKWNDIASDIKLVFHSSVIWYTYVASLVEYPFWILPTGTVLSTQRTIELSLLVKVELQSFLTFGLKWSWRQRDRPIAWVPLHRTQPGVEPRSSVQPTVNLVADHFNPLTPNDLYISRTAPLTSKRCILYIYSTNVGTEYFKHALYSPFFLFKMQFVS